LAGVVAYGCAWSAWRLGWHVAGLLAR
jgi:hypothetical protein